MPVVEFFSTKEFIGEQLEGGKIMHKSLKIIAIG